MGRPALPARALALLAAALLAAPADAQQLAPDGGWLAYADVAEAGYDAALLERARETWQASDSAAFLVLEGGAVVASWGDVERRYMCHSVRKSFLSALFGPYVDEGVIDLDASLADLGIDDSTPLTETEKQATVLQLLQARSGVYLTAAYEPASNPKPERGSELPGARWVYNNWDFNTLVTIFNQVTGDDFFEALDARLLAPLGAQDWRLSDGYYHLQPDMSAHPAYPLRMSGRDMARLGQLFLQEGRWQGRQLLPAEWVARSRTSYSEDTWMGGYGLMWWVFEGNPLEPFGTYAALGVGQQMIAVLPDLDVVMVNRTDTYVGDSPSMTDISGIMLAVIAARTGTPSDEPRLVPLAAVAGDASAAAAAAVVPGASAARAASEPGDAERRASVDAELSGYVGSFTRPPAGFGVEPTGEYQLSLVDGELLMHDERRGSYRLRPLADGSLLQEDRLETLQPWRDAEGTFVGVVSWMQCVDAGFEALLRGDDGLARALLAAAHERFPERAPTLGAGALVALLDDDLAPARLLGIVRDAPAALDVDAWLDLVEQGLREGQAGATAMRVGLLRRRILALHAEALAAAQSPDASVSVAASEPAAARASAPAEPSAAAADASPTRDESATDDAARAARDELVDRYLALYLAGDSAGLAQWLAEDAVFEDPSARLSGRAAIRDGLAETFRELTLEAFDVERRLHSGTHRLLLEGRLRCSRSGASFGRPDERLRFDVPLTLVLGLSDGRVSSHLELVDTAAYERQLLEQLRAD